MTARQLLSRLEAAGVRLSADGDSLRAGPRDAVDDATRWLIHRHKGALLRLLRQRPAEPLPPLSDADHVAIREAIDERAAIHEFDGGLTRQEAETQARAAMCVYRVRVVLPDGSGARWSTMLAQNCDLNEATRTVNSIFGADRVLAVIPEPTRTEASQ